MLTDQMRNYGCNKRDDGGGKTISATSRQTEDSRLFAESLQPTLLWTPYLLGELWSHPEASGINHSPT